MRKTCTLLLMTLLVSPVLMAQKKVFSKRNPSIPFTINTKSDKNIPVPLMKPVAPGRQMTPMQPRQKVTMRRSAMPDTGKFTIVTERIPVKGKAAGNQRRQPAYKDVKIYYPKKDNKSGNSSSQRKMSVYPSITISSQADVDNFNTIYPDCDEVGTLIIDGAGINNLATMGGINNVNELIIRNTSLNNLSGLQGLTSITDSLVLENNSSLVSTSLLNVETLGGLYIRECSSLQTVGPFSSSLTSIANSVEINSSNVSSLSGLSNITSIGRDLDIRNTLLTNLDELSNLEQIFSYLRLEGNNSMTSIALNNLTLIRGLSLSYLPMLTSLGSISQNLSQTDLYTIGLLYMGGLTDISGLSRVTSIMNTYVVGCHQLTSLNGFENITSARYGISLYDNELLSDISAMGQITTAEYDVVQIAFNPQLSSLAGLERITKMDALSIFYNDQLESLSVLNAGLEIYNVNGQDLQIYGNSQLSVCNVPAICNYLNSTNAIDPQIYDNAGDCGDLQSVMESCGTTGGGSLQDITWNGSESEEWDNPQNWTPNTVPGQNSRAIILSDVDYYPDIYNDVNIGGLKMFSSSLYLNGYQLTIGDSVNIYDSYIEGGGYITMNAANPRITFSYFDIYDLNLKYKGGSHFYNNEVYGEVNISDLPSRSQPSYTFGNHFYYSLTLTNNSNYGNNYLSNGNADADIIDENLTINNNSSTPMEIGIGEGEPLHVGRNVQLNSPYTDAFYIDKITFEASLNGIFGVSNPGPGAFEIRKLFFRKNYEASMSIGLPIKVTDRLIMGSEFGAINTYGNNMLIIGDTCTVVDEDPINGSFVDGPLKKIGNTAFTFPIGRIPRMYQRTKNPDQQPTDQRRGPVVVYYKAPLSISAPSETDAAFIAEYIDETPDYNGYNTTEYGPGVGSIQTSGYWKLNRESGASDVIVGLDYNETKIDDAFTPASLQVIGWDGAKWQDLGNGGTTGTVRMGTVNSSAPLTTYGPLALAVTDVRKPIITIAPFDSLVCFGSRLMVYFTLDTNAVEGNTFRVELSDKDGSFASGTIILNSKTTYKTDSIPVTIPSYLVPGNPYRIRIISTQQGLVSENSPLLIPQAYPAATFTIEGSDEICMGSGVIKYYPSVKEEGVTYNWTVTRGTLTVDNDTAFVTYTSAGTAIVRVVPGNNCGNGSAVSKNVVVKPASPTTAPELTNVGRWLYPSTPPAGQTVGVYNWYKNGTLISGAQGSKYYAPDAGVYAVEYANDCGKSPLSNTVTFANVSVSQTITFEGLPNKTFGDEPFSLPGSSSSGLPVSFKIVSGPGNVTAGVYSITHSGAVVIQAYQLGDNDYDTAAPVIQSFVINKASQTITLDSIPDYEFNGRSSTFYLHGTASSGLPVSYTSPSPNVTMNRSSVRVNALGNVTITVTQPGDTNYLPATPASRSFCVRVMDLNPITGAQYVCPGNVSVYKTNKIDGLTYNWRLSDGTSFPSDADTVKITWSTTGTYTLIVSASGPCGPATGNDSLTINVLDATIAPGAVTNMLPANGSIDQKLPLVLSWIPGSNTLSYDIYIWKEGTSKPADAFAPNISAINFTLPQSSLIYDQAYNWQVVSKNGCVQTPGSVQTFKLRKLPDLTVTEVQAPASANSGQTITVNWKVKNIGGGATTTNESWSDAVFLSFDSIPNFAIPPQTQNPNSWDAVGFPVKPLLIGTRKNIASLGIGEEYTSSFPVTLPRSLDQPIYIYVISNYKPGASAPLDADHSNDTARALNPIEVTLTPTPDLRVDTVFAPATTFSGSTINVTYKVTNYGVLTPSGATWTDKLYISKSPLFNIKLATPLKFAKQNETYYPATDAGSNISQQLEHEQSMTRSLEVVIPNFISGTWFIHVVTNDKEKLYEGAFSSNNDNNRPIEVILTPTPQFTINSINLPIKQLSTTQPVGINWNVSNTGLFDNIEKNKGFYGGRIGWCSNGHRTQGPGTSQDMNTFARGGGTGSVTLTPREHDSLSWGSSYWVDKIYISTDPSGFSAGNALYLGQAIKGIQDLGWRMPDDIQQSNIHCGQPHGNVPGGTTENVLRPGSNHPNNFNFKVPADLPEGDYYFYIQTNSTNTVFTYPDVPVIARSEKVTVSWPDLKVPTVTVPAAITGGSSFVLEYVLNNNGAGSVYEADREDKIYVSNSSVLDESATLLKTINNTESLAAGATTTKSVTLKLPYGASGTQYFFVETNAGKAFKEKNFGNNISVATPSNISSAPPADLQVMSVTISDSIYAPGTQKVSLFYEVKNIGTNPGNGETIDSIYMSCNPVFDQSTAVYLTSRTNDRNLAPGASVTDSVSIQLLKQAYLMKGCFAKADFSNAYFFVNVNENSGIYEAENTTNNKGRSDEKVIVNRNADLEVTSVTGDHSATVGRPYKLNWVVTNIAGNSSSFRIDRADSIYFSKDPVFNANAIGVSQSRNTSQLMNPLVPQNNTMSFALPKMEAGDYYVFVVADARNLIEVELNRDNNVNLMRDEFGNPQKIQVIMPLLPDLVSEIVTAPESVSVGQPLEFTYRVTNVGAGATYPDKWNDEVWLTRGVTSKPSSAKGDRIFSSQIHSGKLEAGSSYDISVSVTIPLNTPEGNYLLSSFADLGNLVVEDIDSNNVGWKPVTIYVPAPSDLIVESVTVPDTVYLGYTIDTLKWSVRNNSVNLAKGVSTDGIYLSQNEVFDSSAVLISIKKKDIDLNPLAADTLAITPVVTGVPEGNYHVIVRTDLLNNIFESDKTNNENHTAKQVYVSVKELHLGITQTDNLTEGRYYKLVVPDSLDGSTILVTLKSEDSLSVLNEMFVGKGYVPSVTTFDYKFNTPNYGNQQILIADVTAGTYYVSIRCVSRKPQSQNITVNARKLPFAILQVHSNKGGNGGSVTVKLTGSLFADSMSAVLVNGSATINATKVYFVNSTLAYATFPLQGKPIGVYSVVLQKADRTETTLANGFSIVSPDNGGLYSGGGVNTGPTGPGTQPGCDPGSPAGLNSQLVTEMIVPQKVFSGWPFVIQINFSNPTNMDIPVQTRILYNDKGLPMTVTKGDEKNGNTDALYIELSETDGPPGVLRAGSSGTIMIYSVAPLSLPGHTHVNFNLK